VVSVWVGRVVVKRDGVWCRVKEQECWGIDGTGRNSQ